MLPIIFFVLGAVSALVQSVTIREFLNVFYGNELVLGAVLGIWLLWVAAGSFTGAYLVKKIKGLYRFFITLVTVGAFFPLVQLFLIRTARSVLGVPSGQYIPFFTTVLYSAAVMFPFCFLAGIAFPLGARIYCAKEEYENTAEEISKLYVSEFLGFLAGGAGFTFYFALHYQAYLLLSAAFACVLASVWFLAMKRIKFASKPAGVVFALACLGLSIYSLVASGALEKETVRRRWESLNRRIELVETADTKYQNIAVGKFLGQYSMFGNGNLLFSFPDEYEDAPLANYVLFQHPNPRSVLVIGEVPAGVLGFMLLHPDISVDCVFLDSKLMQAMGRYAGEVPGIKDNNRLKYIHEDGRHYVKGCSRKYDVVFLALPQPSTAMVNRYYTREFFREAAGILEKGGVFACFGASTADAITWQVGNYFSSAYRTLSSVFADVKVSTGYSNYFFCAQETGVVTDDYKVLQERYWSKNVRMPFFSEEHFPYFFPPDRVRYINDFLKEWRWSRVNTDLKPVSYFYSLLEWDAYSGSRMGPLLRRLGEWFRVGWAVMLLGLFLAMRYFTILVRRRTPAQQQRFSALFAIFACGFAAMGLEIMLIFLFQNLYGYLYQMIGFITAVFMCGLAAGGWVALRSLKKNGEANRRRLVFACCGMALFPLLIPFLSWIFASAAFSKMPQGLSQFFFMVPVFLIGFIAGFEFPHASSVYGSTAIGSGKTAGMVGWADNFGGFLGAALCGTLLIPVLGITGACLVISLCSIAAVILLVFQVKTKKIEVMVVNKDPGS